MTIPKYPTLQAPMNYAQRYDSEGNPYSGNNDHIYRSVFAKDRDKILYISAFRRMASKTQVFLSHTTDLIRTRLTHTLEVAQIARTISSALGLNVDLTEAIALGHDLGHTPFGHVGERELHDFSTKGNKRSVVQFTDGTSQVIKIPENLYGFKHNLQSVRVLVDYSGNFSFSNFCLYGVRIHSDVNWKEKNESVAFYDAYKKFWSYTERNKKLIPAWSFEAFIVRWADEAAQRQHDIEDAFRQKILSPSDLGKCLNDFAQYLRDGRLVKRFQAIKRDLDSANGKQDIVLLQRTSGFIIDAYITMLIDEFQKVLECYKDYDLTTKYPEIDESEVFDKIKFIDTMFLKANENLNNSVKNFVIDSYDVQRMDGKGAFIIRQLIEAFLTNPQQLPDDVICRFVQKELSNYKELDYIIKKKGYIPNVMMWNPYQCRDAVRLLFPKEIINPNSNPITDSERITALEQIEIRSRITPILIRVVIDYIAGMTDSFATQQYKELYGVN